MTAMMGGGGYSPTMIPGGTIAGASPMATSAPSMFAPGQQYSGLPNSLAGGIIDIFGGMQANSTYNGYAGQMKAQANEAIRSAEQNAQAKADQVRQYAGNQQEEYASSGITMAGTPAMVLADTRKKGQAEVAAITRQGAFQAQMMRTQAKQAQSSGRNALLGGIFKAGTSVASYFI